MKVNTLRGKMKEITCANPPCNMKRMVRVSDIKRGWGKYCSKSCKADHQFYKKGGKRRFFDNSWRDDIEIYPPSMDT